MKKIKLGIVGCGEFSHNFVPLFLTHPMVEKVVLCDLIQERREHFQNMFKVKDYALDFDELLKSDVDAVCIYTPRHTHAPLALKALEHGKHVYCSVPMAIDLEDIQKIVDTVKRTGLIYMMGETHFYRPHAVYARLLYDRKAYGHLSQIIACGCHDMDNNFYDAFRYSGGKDWKQLAGIPPMIYATHDCALTLSIGDASAKKLSCFGFVDVRQDVFGVGKNMWNSPYSNQTALIDTDKGHSVVMCIEHRGVLPVGYPMYSVQGTDAIFDSGALGATWSYKDKDDWAVVHTEDITGILRNGPRDIDVNHVPHDINCYAVNSDIHLTYPTTEKYKYPTYEEGIPPVHNNKRLPAAWRTMYNTENGTTHYLADDFVKAVAEEKLPPIDVWRAASYTAPGIVAHDSCMHGGVLLEVPNYGMAPKELPRLDPDKEFLEGIHIKGKLIEV